MDFAHSFPFIDASLDGNFREYVPGDLTREDSLAALCYCRRILAPGGVLREVVSDEVAYGSSTDPALAIDDPKYESESLHVESRKLCQKVSIRLWTVRSSRRFVQSPVVFNHSREFPEARGCIGSAM